jgi:hypothetical protein
LSFPLVPFSFTTDQITILIFQATVDNFIASVGAPRDAFYAGVSIAY